jgi:hypothetical protein
MTETLDDRTKASDPGRITLLPEKMRRFHPEIYQYQGLCRRWKKQFTKDQIYQQTRSREHLENGDSRAAVVISLSPLIIAAYTDELDCVAMLKFPPDLVQEYGLRVGSRLLTVNIYRYGDRPVSDLENGPASYRRHSNFEPYIAEFLSADYERIDRRKLEISEQEWNRTIELAHAYLDKHGSRFRDGYPLRCLIPAIG